MPRIPYVPKDFQDKSLAVIGAANRIIDDYQAQGMRLTLRQLYYRFVAADLLPNNQRSYNRLGSIINDARLAGLVDWDAIEDRGRNRLALQHWKNPQSILRSAASGFDMDHWEDQDVRVEVWVEKQALESVVWDAASAWDVPVFACKGYTSQSEMWRAAQRFRQHRQADQRVVILHLGDHDPSGIDMTRDIRERLNDVFRVRVTVDRIALNMDQIEQYDPPPNPAKLSDSRARDYIARYGRSSWELDALEPAVMRELIQDHIIDLVDVGKYEDVDEQVAEDQKALRRVADDWEDLTGEL